MKNLDYLLPTIQMLYFPNESIVEKMVKSRMLTDDEVLTAISSHCNIPLYKIEDAIDDEVIAEIGWQIAREYKVIPITNKFDQLVVGITDPSDVDKVEAMSRIIGNRPLGVQLVLIRESDYEKAFDLYYLKQMTRDMRKSKKRRAKAAAPAV